MLGDLETAQDALQDLFLKLIDARASICVDRKFASWLFAVAHHMCCNEYRSRDVRSRAMTRLVFESNLASPDRMDDRLDDRIDDNLFTQYLEIELGQLDIPHRSAFLLRHQEGLSIRQISAILGCPPGTVKSRLHYTCRRLAARLGRFDPREREDPCYGTNP
jgi:RNA polymerase sigma-70 factor (ECF subfamily)